MVDLDTQMKIDALMDFAYDKTIERIAAIEDASESSIYRTIVMDKGNARSYFEAFLNYYHGTFEGILFTRFLEEMNRMPTPSENAFIVENIGKKWEGLIDAVEETSIKKFNRDNG